MSVLIQFFRHLSRYQYGYQIWCSARYSSKSWPGHSYRTFHGNSNTVLPSKHMPVFKNFLRQNLGSFKYNLIKTGLNFSRPLLEYGSCFMRSIKIACEMVFLFNFFPFYNIAWKAITMEKWHRHRASMHYVSQLNVITKHFKKPFFTWTSWNWRTVITTSGEHFIRSH